MNSTTVECKTAFKGPLSARPPLHDSIRHQSTALGPALERPKHNPYNPEAQTATKAGYTRGLRMAAESVSANGLSTSTDLPLGFAVALPLAAWGQPVARSTS